MAEGQRAGPLAGTRVLEFSQIIAAPLAGMLLADMGADVVKVESPNGDRTRRSGSIAPGTSKRFQWLNRGKRSLVLDLERPEARELVYERLLPRFGIVINNFRLQVARSLGIDYETIAARRADVIYARITGFGASGPLADDPAIDLIVQAYSGMMADEGRLDAEGTPIGTQSMWVADLIAGLSTALGVTAAVHHRERTGEGQLVDASLLRGAMAAIGSSVMREPVSDAIFSQPAWERVRSLIEGGASFPEVAGAWGEGNPLRQLGAVRRLYQSVYMATDGPLVLGATSPGHREAIRGVLGTRDEGGDDPDFDPLAPGVMAEIEELRQELAAIIRARPVAEWVEAFRAAGAPVAPMHFSPQLADDPQAGPLFTEIDDPITGEPAAARLGLRDVGLAGARRRPGAAARPSRRTRCCARPASATRRSRRCGPVVRWGRPERRAAQRSGIIEGRTERHRYVRFTSIRRRGTRGQASRGRRSRAGGGSFPAATGRLEAHRDDQGGDPRGTSRGTPRVSERTSQ